MMPPPISIMVAVLNEAQHVESTLTQLAPLRLREVEVVVVDGGSQGRHLMLRIVATLMNWRSRLTGIATGEQALFIWREAFERVGGFPDQPLMEDIEMSPATPHASAAR